MRLSSTITSSIVVSRMKITLTDREADVMQVLWDHWPSVVSDVRNRLKDKLAHTTVLTVLRTLEDKGSFGHEEKGRQYRYLATVQERAAQKSALQHLLGKLFKNSSELLFARFVSDQKLSPQEIRRMRKLLGGKTR